MLEALSIAVETPVYGHEAGDAVLCELARRFDAHREELGTVARLGGNEFALAFTSSAEPGHAAHNAQLVSHPVQLETVCVDVGATIGIAMFPRDGSDLSTLLHAADLAM